MDVQPVRKTNNDLVTTLELGNTAFILQLKEAVDFISDATHHHPIDHTEWSDLYDRIDFSEMKDHEVLAFMRYVTKHPFAHSRVVAEKAFLHFSKKYPDEMSRYFHSGPIVNMEGAMEILKGINAKHDRDIPVAPLNPESLKEFVLSERGHGHFILKDRHMIHYIPLTMRKTGSGVMEVLITDSLGCCGSNDVRQIFLEAHLPPPDITLYVRGRQHDSVHCSIFAIRDVAQFCAMEEAGVDIFELIEPYCTNTFGSVRRCTYLPPEMMTTTQSLSEMESYQTRFGDAAIYSAGHRHPVGDAMRNHTYHSIHYARPFNSLIEHRFVKYFTILLEKTLNERAITV